MAKMNFHRNTFLEKEELNRFSELFSGLGVVKGMLKNSYSFGIVSKNRIHPTEFAVTADEATGINVGGGYIVDNLGRVVYVSETPNITFDKETYYWVKVSLSTRTYEKGTVAVTADGTLSGTVNFSKIVRGQSSGVPTCIRFVKEDGSTPLNNHVYQVSTIISDTNLTLTGGQSFVAESNLKVIVLGTIPFGGVFSEEQLEGLYTMDSYDITLVPEVTPDEMPAKGDNEFYLARVYRNDGVIIQDKRTEFWRFSNVEEYDGYTGFYVKEEV